MQITGSQGLQNLIAFQLQMKCSNTSGFVPAQIITTSDIVTKSSYTQPSRSEMMREVKIKLENPTEGMYFDDIFTQNPTATKKKGELKEMTEKTQQEIEKFEDTSSGISS